MITKLNFTDRTIKSYAIRKLTPKECFRLMGVRDNVIAVMQMTVASVMQRMKSVLGKCFPTVRFDRIKNKEDVMMISAHSSTSKPETASWWTCWPTSTSSFSTPYRPIHARANSSRSSTTPKTRYPTCRHRRQERGEDIPHHVLRLRLAAHGSRRATRVASRLSLDVQGMERHRQIRLSDAQPRLPSVCRLRPWRHHQD